MVVANNILAMNANRMFGITTNKLKKSSEKLSSGYKINRAADDAAGLAISEKMRRQIRGLTQGAANIQDGISLCQVADGALHEMHDVLQRMNELAVQAANDTNSDSDRQAIQVEIDELTKEADRIANCTSFNEGIFPLKRKSVQGSEGPDLSGGVGEWRLPPTLSNADMPIYVYGDNVTIDGEVFNSNPNLMWRTVVKYTGEGQPDGVLFEWFSKKGYGGNVTERLQAQHLYEGDSWYSLTLDDMKIDDDGYVYFEDYQGKRQYLQLKINDSIGAGLTETRNSNCLKGIRDGGSNIPGYGSTVNSGNIWIQMGANADEGMYLSLVDATAKSLGITDPPLDVSDHANAGASIDRIVSAIHKVSSFRMTFGVQQNRLEHGYNVNLNTVENTQYAESQIRDTDMAKEMVEQSAGNILAQAGIAMMTHANTANEGVLMLLRQ